MKIARVIGQVVSTVKHKSHEGHKLLLVQPVDSNGKASGISNIAIDGAQAGVGDLVLVVYEGKGARQIIGDKETPCEAIIAGIVDHLVIRNKKKMPSELVKSID